MDPEPSDRGRGLNRWGQQRQGRESAPGSLACEGVAGGKTAGRWRGDEAESEPLQFSRGEVGIDHENFSRKLRGEKKGRDPKIEYVNMQRWVSFLNRSLLLI